MPLYGCFNGELLAALGATTLNNLAPSRCAHALAESVCLLAAFFLGLECAFHVMLSLIRVSWLILHWFRGRVVTAFYKGVSIANFFV